MRREGTLPEIFTEQLKDPPAEYQSFLSDIALSEPEVNFAKKHFTKHMNNCVCHDGGELVAIRMACLM